MSRDDYISKLFIKNQDKLEQAPSDDLWSKLEMQLDQDLSIVENVTSTPTASVKMFSLSRYFAAASVLVAVVGSIYLFNLAGNASNVNEQIGEPLAIYTDAEPLADEAEVYKVYDKLPIDVKETEADEEVKEQTEKIVEAVNEKISEVKNGLAVTNTALTKVELEDIEILDEQETEDIILIEPEAEPAVVTNTNSIKNSNSGVSSDADLYMNNFRVEGEQKDLNYNRSYVPQVANTIDNSSVVEEVLNKSKAKKEVAAKKSKSKVSKARGERRKLFSKNKAPKKIKSPMASAHPRLYPFGFLLGKWSDNYEYEGKSYEVWTLKNSTTLMGRGYKLSKNAERIFEELMRIEFRDNQIFLVMSFDENKKTVEYMLTNFNNERFEFEQLEYRNYPHRVIIQQSGLDGYSVIISNNEDFLTPDQQRYLDNRNRVSQVKAYRIMRYEE